MRICTLLFAFLMTLAGTLPTAVGWNERNIDIFIDAGDPVFTVLYPRLTDPVIVEKNSSFTIRYTAPYHEKISVSISTAYDPLPDYFNLEVEDLSLVDETWLCTVRVPSQVHEELYNLSVSITIGKFNFTVNVPKAVAVKEKITGNFTFIHITDFHIGDPRGIKESLWKTLGWKAAHRCIKEVNLLNPDFVVITGDLVYGQLYPGEYRREYRKCWEILQEFQVPIYICPGNHDGYIQLRDDGFKYWREYFGPLYYSFDYGKSHFICANSYDWSDSMRRSFLFIPLNWGGCVSDEQVSWIENDLLNSSGSKLKVMLIHHNPIWDTERDSLLGLSYHNREKLLSIIEDHGVDAVLSGHVHFDSVTTHGDTLFITTTTSCSNPGAEDAYWGYRMITVRNYTIVSYNYREPKYSIPLYHIDCREEGAYGKLIENKLDINITVTVNFLVPKGRYIVSNGTIKMIREKNNMMEVYVTVNVPMKSKVFVALNND